ncbi:MAG: electron transporter RnfC, partial [Planctomycetia bacterium]|nr:electron transporter RnfC [Planctomycetia bacterium]
MADSVTTYTFPRGVHPREGKSFSEKCAIEVLPIPEELWIPLSQHIGAPASVSVKVRDVVEFGQALGEAAGFVSAPVYAPLPGTVKKMSSVTLPNGRRVPTVVMTVKTEGAVSTVNTVST